MEESVVYFSFKDWLCGRDYPNTENFRNWMRRLNETFKNDSWAKENNLCVFYENLGPVTVFLVSAPKSWVENNFPEIFTEEYSTFELLARNSIEKGDWKPVTLSRKYSSFRDYPEESIEKNIDWDYLSYKKENFGSRQLFSNELRYFNFGEDEIDDD